MNTIQIASLGIGALIALSFFVDMSKITDLFSSKAKQPLVSNSNLVTIVKQWQDFRQACSDNDLKDAVVKLDEIFPILVKTEN